jgi:hypothetical protein
MIYILLCVQLKNDGDFLFFLADAAAIAVCIIFFYVASIEKYLFFLRADAILQFQYGNPDALCPQLIKAKKNRNNLVVHVPSSIVVLEIFCNILLE